MSNNDATSSTSSRIKSDDSDDDKKCPAAVPQDQNNVEMNGEETTKDEEEDEIIYQSTTDLKSERELARSLGYPKKWHVTRIVPHPSCYSPTTFMDIIYCGDPSDAPDCYYNHNAALTRALEWKEGVSTGFEGRGGQMLARCPLYEQDEVVEVSYEGSWYKAKVVQVKEYDDDVRYTVYYIGEDSTQSNVAEEDIRKRVVKKEKGTAKSKAKQTSIKDYIVDNESALKLAQEFGLPEGWTAETRVGGKFYIQSPDKQHTFRSKKTAHDFISSQERTMKKISNKLNPKKSSRAQNEYDIAKSLGLPSGWKAKHEYSISGPDGTTYSSLKRALETIQPKSSKKQKKDSQSNAKKEEIQSNDFTIVSRTEEDNGDPPWRRTGHNLLGRCIKYNTQIGKVTGWIKESDVDSTGTAAYISNKTNKPGRLFHVNFRDGDLLFADFEEWEVEKLLVEENCRANGDDDSIPLSKMKR